MKMIHNSRQRKAIRHMNTPLMIIAGAGTGKTTVITERIKFLISKNGVKPSEVLALTFTEKAAIEMEERVDRILPYGYSQMWITTFHSFADRVLRQESMHLGLDPGYKLMTAADAVLFFKKNLFNFKMDYFRPLGNPTKFSEAMLSHFARLKDEDISPDQYDEWVKKFSKTSGQTPDSGREVGSDLERIRQYSELAMVYRQYERLKAEKGMMDFGDLISYILKLFRTRIHILEEYRRKFRYILIDEYQDTNIAQNEIARILASEGNITVVADDDQAIYRWRGASVSNIIQFRENFPDAEIIVLNRNYRSTKTILDASYKLISFNNPDRLEIRENIKKKLIPIRKVRGDQIGSIYAVRVEDEADLTVKKIMEIKEKSSASGGYAWKDFAILVRANNHAEPFVRALNRHGVPYQFLGPARLFRQTEIKQLISYLKFLADPMDSVALFSVLSMEVFDISQKDIIIMNAYAKSCGLSLFNAIDAVVSPDTDQTHWSKTGRYADSKPFVSSDTTNKLVSFMRMAEKHMGKSRSQTAGQILYYFLEDSGLLKRLMEYSDTKEERTALNISKFFETLKKFELSNENAGVNDAVDWIEMAMELGESPLVEENDINIKDAVNLLTVHSSKGLEFPVVFLVNLVSGRFPTSQRPEKIPIPEELVKELLPQGDYHLQEERRLFYVGMTRAKDLLFFTASRYYGEGIRERKISQFVPESLGMDIASQISEKEKSRQLSFSDWIKKEEKIAEPVNSLAYLSYTQIDSFSVCPLQYKYRYVYKIPVPQTSAGSFGTSVHSALEKFYKGVKAGKKPSKKDLLQMLSESWIPVGYRNRSYEERMKLRGSKMLENYYDNFYDENFIPRGLEQIFKIRLSEDLKIGGKIDRVDDLSDGSIEIIDYKTGKKYSDKEIKNSLQMTVYAMAAADPGLYGRKVDTVILSFYFLEDGIKISSKRTKDQIEKAKEGILRTADEIRKSSFPPKKGIWCKYCDFRLLCEAWK